MENKNSNCNDIKVEIGEKIGRGFFLLVFLAVLGSISLLISVPAPAYVVVAGLFLSCRVALWLSNQVKSGSAQDPEIRVSAHSELRRLTRFRKDKDITRDLRYSQVGSVGLSLTSTTRKQSSAKKPARRAKKTKSGDGKTDPDPEPPRQLLYTFKSFAQLVDCSEKTLRNKVSAGLFPQPQKTAFGPRFTQQHLDYAVTPAKPPKTRGRPRIADSIQGGVQ